MFVALKIYGRSVSISNVAFRSPSCASPLFQLRMVKRIPLHFTALARNWVVKVMRCVPSSINNFIDFDFYSHGEAITMRCSAVVCIKPENCSPTPMALLGLKFNPRACLVSYESSSTRSLFSVSLHMSGKSKGFTCSLFAFRYRTHFRRQLEPQRTHYGSIHKLRHTKKNRWQCKTIKLIRFLNAKP